MDRSNDVPMVLGTSLPLLEGTSSPDFRHSFHVKVEYHSYAMSKKKIEVHGLKLFFNNVEDCQPAAIKTLFLSQLVITLSSQEILLHPNSIK
ncbi:hypothetical protein P9112_006242 [Eukaryota sp. TZLM1-RC]